MLILYRIMDIQDAAHILHIDRSERIASVYTFEKGTLLNTPAGHECANWNEAEYDEIQQRFMAELQSGGTAVGAYAGERLVGFGVLAHKRRGKDNTQLQLDLMYVTREYRGRGVGSVIFDHLKKIAMERGAKELYISATETESAVTFYQSRGAVLAEELDPELFAKEPLDIHMIIPLNRTND